MKNKQDEMVPENSEETTTTSTSEVKSDSKKGGGGGKKRLSKKERKAFKKNKKQKLNSHHDNDDKSKEASTENDKDAANQKSQTEKSTSPPPPAKKKDNQEEEDEEALMKSYTPIPVPDRPSSDVTSASKSKQVVKSDDIEEGGGGAAAAKTLGKWFPNALLVKCPVNYTNTGKLLLNDPTITPESVQVDNPRASLVLFYQYTNTKQKWSPTRLQLLMTYLQQIAAKRQIGGRIRVAQEGVNATISAVDVKGGGSYCTTTAKETLRHFGQDLKNFDPVVFRDTDFKYIDDLPADRHFKELKVIPVQELVFYDIAADEAPLDIEGSGGGDGDDDNVAKDGIKGGVHLDAKEYHEMLKKENAVVIDVRNHYETIIGRFDGQEKTAAKTAAKAVKAKNNNDDDDTAAASAKPSGAEYLDPLMRKSTDFKSWLAKDDTKEKLKDKTVLMYCTGGIRCERASAYLKKEMGQEVEGVYQLQGGIERYLKAFPDGGFWRGKNFVFDKREAVGVDNPEGDGGVIRKDSKKKKKNKKKSDDEAELPSKCCVCSVAWDRYVGKKKCYTCGVPVLMCDKCMSLKPDKTPGMQLKVRCPLCVTENVTKPASEVDWTANGMKSKVVDTKDDEKDGGKAAASVLKWGGGHATNKKLGRKVKGRMCRFGAECVRKDCFFDHPAGRHAPVNKNKKK